MIAQGVPIENQIPSSTIPGLTGELGLFNSEKLQMQQGFTFGTSLMGNQSVSYGMLSNNFQYNVNSKINVSGGVHLLQRNPSLPGQFQSFNPDILYDVNIQYKPSEKAWFQLSFCNIGYPQHRFRQFSVK